MRPDLAVASVAGLFGLIPLIVQIASARAQRRDRMTRLNQLRAELELLERINTLQGQVSAGDEAAKHRTSLIVSDSLSKLLDDYNKLSEIAPSAVGGGWILHTMFYVWGFVGTALNLPLLLTDPTLFVAPSSLVTLVAIFGIPLLIIQRLARRNAARNAAQLEEPNA